MLNTPFKNKSKEKEMTKLYSQIFAVLMGQNKPILSSVIWLNDNFEDLYYTFDTEVEVYEYVFQQLEVQYIKKNY